MKKKTDMGVAFSLINKCRFDFIKIMIYFTKLSYEKDILRELKRERITNSHGYNRKNNINILLVLLTNIK